MASAAENFLRRLHDASRAADALGALGGDPSGFDAAAEVAPEALQRAMEDDAARAPGTPAFINGAAFASATCDRDGFFVTADARFRAWLDARPARAELGAKVRDRAGVSFLIEEGGRFIAVAAAPAAMARSWPLDRAVRACLESGRSEIAVLARLPPASRDMMLSRAARLFGFTGLEARVSAGLIDGGGARGAATFANVSYETARDALKSAMRKTGARKQSEFVALLIQAESVESATASISSILQDFFSLSARQADAALLMAQGATRAEAALALRVSENVVKADMRAVFAAMLVDSTAALSQIVGEIAALSALASAVAVDIQAGASREPLRILPRSNRPGRIAYADHGPFGAAPTLFLHSATTGRHLPECYIFRLQQLGLRPVTLDRPGYGLTTMTEGDYLESCAEDIREILDDLGLERAHIVCRSGAIGVVRFAQIYPGRLDRAVLINPEPPASYDTRYEGVFGGIKRLLQHNPTALRALTRMLSRRALPSSVLNVARAAVARSEADSATLADENFSAAFVRASQQAALQEGAGLVALQRCVANAALAPAAFAQERFTLLFGEQDPLQAADDAVRWWSTQMPRSRTIRIENAGRFLHAQHPERIAEALLNPI